MSRGIVARKADIRVIMTTFRDLLYTLIGSVGCQDYLLENRYTT